MPTGIKKLCMLLEDWSSQHIITLCKLKAVKRARGCCHRMSIVRPPSLFESVNTKYSLHSTVHSSFQSAYQEVCVSGDACLSTGRQGSFISDLHSLYKLWSSEKIKTKTKDKSKTYAEVTYKRPPCRFDSFSKSSRLRYNLHFARVQSLYKSSAHKWWPSGKEETLQPRCVVRFPLPSFRCLILYAEKLSQNRRDTSSWDSDYTASQRRNNQEHLIIITIISYLYLSVLNNYRSRDRTHEEC
jgi:hypothetical protein